MSVDAEWHRAHKMPKNLTLEQRLAWHREHDGEPPATGGISTR